MQHCIVALSSLLFVASITSGMPSAPVGPPGSKRSGARGGTSMPALPPPDKRSADGEAAMPAFPIPPPMPMKRASEAVQELRTSDTTIDQGTKIATDLPGEPLSPADFENAVRMNLPEIDLGLEIDPIELANKFEGDIIIMNKTNLPNLTQNNGRNANKDTNKRWANGIVPYIISSSYNKKERATIAVAMKSYHDETCLRFVPRTIEQDYIQIIKGDGCFSSVGRIGGEQAVILGIGCLYPGTVMHELMHVVGFWHEQSRQDRDRYITINWSNIQNGMKSNFKKLTLEKISHLDVEYDTDSIMHFSAYAFAKDRSKPTITVHKTGVKIGQRRALSKTDIRKLNILYECPGVDNSGGGNNIINPTPVKPPQPRTPCKDQSPHCDYWKTNGECTKNSEYMTLFCKSSCGACHGKDVR